MTDLKELSDLHDAAKELGRQIGDITESLLRLERALIASGHLHRETIDNA